MALDLISQPASPCFARNPCVWKLQAAYTLAKGVRSTLTIGALSDRFATNETVTITYTEPDGTTEAVVFTAKAVYDDYWEIPDSSFAGTNSAYWSAVIAIIGGHPRVAPFFTVEFTDTLEITIQARSLEAGWDIALTTSSAFAVADFAAEATTLDENYKVIFEVYVERSYYGGDYRLAATLQGTPDEVDGYIYFDISSILSAECRASREEPLVPVWDTTTPVLADNLRRYYVRYTEESGEPPVAADWTYSGGIKLAMDGGISQSLFAEGGFLDALDETDALLTWMPDGRRVSLEQPEFLAWYNHTAGTLEVYIEMQWYDIADNALSSAANFYNGSPLSVRAGEVGLFPVSATLMGLDSEPDAYKYRVRVKNGLDDWSQWRTYYIDRDYYESERYVQYLNGFGVPECWRCTGDWTKRLKVERQRAVKPLQPGYNTFASDRYQFGRLWDHELVYRTGYLSAAEADVLQEMLLAGELYDVSSEGYIPLQITTGDFNVVDTRQNLRAYEFRAQPRLDMKSYSKKKLSSLLAGAWLEPGGQAWFDAFLVAWEEP